MLHVFQLGPLTLGERLLWLLSAVDQQGGISHPVLERELPEGVAAFAARHGAEHLRAEPALAEFAAPLGIESAPLPAHALKPRAVLAFAFANAHALFHSPSVVASFLEACARFGDAAPWMRFTSREAFQVLLYQGWHECTREAAVLGSDEDCGFALYDRLRLGGAACPRASGRKAGGCTENRLPLRPLSGQSALGRGSGSGGLWAAGVPIRRPARTRVSTEPRAA